MRTQKFQIPAFHNKSSQCYGTHKSESWKLHRLGILNLRGFTMSYLNCLQKSRLAFNRSRIIASGSQCLAVPQSSSEISPKLADHGQVSQRCFSTFRRKRPKYEKFNNPEMGTQFPPASGMEDPFEYTGDTIDEYTEKATLSPWTPVPDSVARKIFDRADPQDDDVSRVPIY
jgi:hypothetical protein